VKTSGFEPWRVVLEKDGPMDKLKEEKTIWPCSHTLQLFSMPLTRLPSHVSMFVHVLWSFRVV